MFVFRNLSHLTKYQINEPSFHIIVLKFQITKLRKLLLFETLRGNYFYI